MGSRQHQASIEQCHKFSLTTQTEHEQISTKKEKPLVDVAITIDKLLSEYPASDSFERKSSDGLNIRAIQKSIFGT